ncbi:multiprotein-bridging factor 1 family protein [Lactiplantibacillus daoliensis]|uniref:Multiprotein-bridging factor 1 family protein n=1 Tax=Lactiplantibacillus daoliensis TaxID=2559916 RepID=A0ABW1UHY7_9LACO|nr:helix-turn-helix transcriptional regulator [Lactiplantibacillus daoliensis]
MRDSESDELVAIKSARLDLGVKVRDLREKLGMSQRELAALIVQPPATVVEIENGSINVSLNRLSDIATAMNRRLTIQFI